MARIDSLGESLSYPVPDRKKAGKREKAQRKSFSDLVTSAEDAHEASTEDLAEDDPRRGIEDLLDAVFVSGDQLKKGPTLEAIKEYRHRVREFVRYAVGRSIVVEETTSGTNILKRKRFTLVKVIDQKLEALAASVLSSQRDQLAILAQIDEINGLLVDLVS
jgi:uncharacterized protein YaaR (DUF327 family)